jgi:DNA invertase Pin-like site-specific DNA recombinase
MKQTTMPRRVIGYTRVSTSGQAEDGVSLAVQREKITQFCALYDYELVDIVEDAGASAKTLQRPGLQDALRRLEADEAGALVVAKLDRLTRSVADLAELIAGYFDGRFDLVSISEQVNTTTAAGRLVLNVLISVAQWEREAIGERTKAALQHKRKSGERVGSVPYGYYLEADGVRLVEDNSEQEVIRAVIEFDAAGLSLRAISGRLKQLGYRARSGGVFHPQTVSNILAAQQDISKQAA